MMSSIIRSVVCRRVLVPRLTSLPQVHCLRLCSTSNGGSSSNSKNIAPEDFFDPEVEKEKEFLDMTTSMTKDLGIAGLCTLHGSEQQGAKSWNDIESLMASIDDDEDEAVIRNLTDVQLEERNVLNIKKMKNEQTITEVLGEYDDDASYSNKFGDDDDEEESSGPSDSQLLEQWTDKLQDAGLFRSEFANHAAEFKTGKYMPAAALNYNVEWASDKEYTDETLDKFVSPLAEENYTPDSQGFRACPGKRQRQGPNSVLRCHLLDVEDLNYLDADNLRRFTTEDSEIMGRRITGLCAKCQRKVAKNIRRARNIGIMPHIGQFIIRDSVPGRKQEVFHDAVTDKGSCTSLLDDYSPHKHSNANKLESPASTHVLSKTLL